MEATDLAYIAGLFDGEGNVMCKTYKRRKRPSEKYYDTMYIRVEVAMTDEEAINYLQNTLNMGWSAPKRFNSRPNRRLQWRWCCGYRDALKFAKMIIPYAKTKKEKLQKIIKHYETSL